MRNLLECLSPTRCTSILESLHGPQRTWGDDGSNFKSKTSIHVSAKYGMDHIDSLGRATLPARALDQGEVGETTNGQAPECAVVPHAPVPNPRRQREAPACASIGERLRCIAQCLRQGHSVTPQAKLLVAAIHRPLCGEKLRGEARVPPWLRSQEELCEHPQVQRGRRREGHLWNHKRM